jgi:hypothetical protein
VQIALQQRYKFTLAFENTAQADYVSERWWDALIAGSVPVRAFPVGSVRQPAWQITSDKWPHANGTLSVYSRMPSAPPNGPLATYSV